MTTDLDEKGLEAATAALCGDNTGAAHKYRELADIAIRAYKAEGINWQAWYRKEHSDLCHVEACNYVLEQRIKALEGELRGVLDWFGTNGLEHEASLIRKALGEGIE